MRIQRASETGRDWIAGWEGGYRLKAYLCPAKVWTISAGVTVYPSGGRVKEDDFLPDIVTSKAMFRQTLRRYEQGVDAMTRDDLTQREFDALVSFVWNLGLKALETSHLLGVVNANGPLHAVAGQLGRWIYADVDPQHPGLEKVEGLVRRREAEAIVFGGGEYLQTDEIKARLGLPEIARRMAA